MDEFQHFEKLSTDNDFEEGQWINGEFVYKKRKRATQQTEDDRLYGVFQGSSDEEGPGFSSRRGRKSGADSRKYHKTVSFVSTGTLQDTEPAKAEGPEPQPGVLPPTVEANHSGLGLGRSAPTVDDVKAEASDDDGAAPVPEEPLSGTARAIKAAADAKRAALAAEAEATKRRKTTLRSDPKIGKFEAHTKGVGSRLLMRMGWKPGEGLGSKRDGISAPLQASLRPKLAGLGAAGQEAGLDHGAAKKGDKEETKTAAAKAGKSAAKEAWMARNRVKAAARTVYKTAEELIAEREQEADAAAASAARAAPAITILDMTGPQTRVIQDMSQLNADKDGGVDGEDGGDAAAAFPELQHNLKLLVEMAEGDIAQLDGRQRMERDTAILLGDQVEKLTKQMEEAQLELKRTTAVLDLLQVVEQRAAATPVPEHELQAIYASLKADYPVEYKLFNCAEVALAQVIPSLSATLAAWDPLAAPLAPLQAFTAWKTLLDDGENGVLGADGREDADGAAASSLRPFTELVLATIVNPVQRACATAWNPLQPDALLKFFDHWSTILPRHVARSLLCNAVLPRIQAAVTAWDGRAPGAPPIHLFVHPWLTYLSEELKNAYPQIRHKLSVSLQSWHPWEPTAKATLAPWRAVWGKREWQTLTDQVIVPPLEAGMVQYLSLSPIKTDTRACEWIAAWVDVLAPAQVAGIYERAFFPKLHEILYTWITHEGVIFDEVWPWFEQIKRAHVPALVLEDERVKHQLFIAFTAVHNCQNGIALPAGYPIVPPLAAAPSSGAAAGLADAAARAAIAADEAEVERKSVKEFLAEEAERAGLVFQPRLPPRMVFGLQVYSLGSLSVVMDTHAGVIKAFIGEAWKPMDIESAIQVALQRA